MFPVLFVQSVHDLLGAEAGALLDALRQPPPPSIRYNEKKTALHGGALKNNVPWCPAGAYLNERPTFTLDPLMHAGGYYVQEASSMFPAQLAPLIAALGKQCRVLDLCAAPGGKSTLLANLLPPDGLLVANEVIRSRANILLENLGKWGFPNTVITGSDPQQFGALSGVFDLLLMDAPCSGEGMFRKDVAAVAEWSAAKVQLCAERQRRIVADAWNALREGGILVYSTCTFNRHENEENVHWIMKTLGAEPVRLPLVPAWGIAESDGGYRFYPHRVQGEGFFMSVLRKTTAPKTAQYKAKNHMRQRTAIKDTRQIASWLPETVVFETHNNFIRALPDAQHAFIASLAQQVHVLQAGVPVGEQKGNDIVPAAALALSTALQPAAFARAEINLPTALHFLHRDNIALPAAEKGFVLLCYNALPLGFVKNIGARTNNLYPLPWRIRMNLV